MSNHQGNFDPFAVYQANSSSLPGWAKEELFKIPVFGTP